MHLSPQDSRLFIEQHKSGFERPADLEFEDYTQGIKAATSDSSLNPPKVRAKLWPFSKKNKVNLHTFLHFHFQGIEGKRRGAITAGMRNPCTAAEGWRESWRNLRESFERRAGRVCPEVLGLCSDLKQNIFINTVNIKTSVHSKSTAVLIVQSASTSSSKVNLLSKTVLWNLCCRTVSIGRPSTGVREMVLGGFP